MRQSRRQGALRVLLACVLLHLVASPLAAQQNGQAKGTDTSLLVGADYVQSYKKQNPGLQIVDVRGRRAFERAHIPGAIHVPLGLAPSKSFAPSEPLILVGSGAEPDLLFRVCGKLREKGIRASFLWGGIARWREAGGRLSGESASRPILNTIAPADYFRQRKKNYWRVLYVGKERPRDLENAMPRAKHVTPDSRLASHPEDNEGPRLLLLVTRDGEGYHSLESTLRQRDMHNIFRLKGGFKAYRGHLRARKDKTNQENKKTNHQSSCHRHEEKHIKSSCSEFTK